MIYLNHAATSHPRPPEVVDAVAEALRSGVGDSGRTARSCDPAASARSLCARLFDVEDPLRVAFFPSATHAINTVLHGLLPGGHAVTTALEHNSVLRPLTHLVNARNISVTRVAPGKNGRIEPGDIAEAVREGTRVIAVSHAANATGAIQDVEAIADVAARNSVPLLIDASQSAGVIPLSHGNLPGRVFIAFAGHKALLGPPGTGGLVLPDGLLPQLIVGGTGISSESLWHPGELPLRHEAGTPNGPGIAGLAAGVTLVLGRGVEAEGARRHSLVMRLRESLGALPRVSLVPLPLEDGRAGIVSFNLAGFTPGDLAAALWDVFEIETRAGLHCAPFAHHCMGTAPLGTVRASVGWGTAMADTDALIEAVRSLAGGAE